MTSDQKIKRGFAMTPIHSREQNNMKHNAVWRSAASGFLIALLLGAGASHARPIHDHTVNDGIHNFETAYHDGLIDPDLGRAMYQPIDEGPEGWVIIEGDILIREEDARRLEEGESPRGVFDTAWWPNGVVPYRFNANVSTLNRQRTRDAMDEIEQDVNVQFIVRTNENNYIEVQNSTRNASAVGMQGGEQVLEMISWGNRYIIIHELMHALGIWHEQSRDDRDTYVTINYDNIRDSDPPVVHNFDTKDGAEIYGFYDFESVMHYGQCAFLTSDCTCSSTCRTISVKSPWGTDWQSVIGQRTRLSKTDVLTMQMMYPEPGDVFVDRSYTWSWLWQAPNGTFLRPHITLEDAMDQVSPGRRIIIQPGTYTGNTGIHDKRVTLIAPLGGVVVR
jgi:hypothetical protein